MSYPIISTDHLCELFEAGYTAMGIAHQYGVSDTFVRTRLKARGYTLRRGRPRIYDNPKARPSYTKSLRKARARRRAQRAHKKRLETKRKRARDIYDATHGEIDRRRRVPSLCEKGNCRWLTPTCLRSAQDRDKHPGYCSHDHVPDDYCKEFRRRGMGDTLDTRYPGWSPCKYYREACSRQQKDCPFRFRTQWTCENCGMKVLIGDIHFVSWSGGRALQERKFRFDKSTPTIPAMALCTSCLDQYRVGANPDPFDDL